MIASVKRRVAPERTAPTVALVLARPGGDHFERTRGTTRPVRLSRRPPPGVAVVENRTGSGAWLLKWCDPKSKKVQYAYDVRTIVVQRGEMFAKNLALGAVHSQIVRRYRQDIVSGPPRERLVAAMIALIDQCCFRPGNDESTAVHAHYGLTTLETRHVRVWRNRMTFLYVGKAGVEQHKVLTDGPISSVLKDLARAGRRTGDEARFFAIDGVPIRAEHLNAVLPDGITAKMFRPFHATRLAAELMMAARGRRRSIPAAERPAVLAEVYRRVAERLGNTPAICRTNYVDPTVVDAILSGGV